MKLLDSNIIIYSYQPDFKHLKALITEEQGTAVSAISRVEILGYHKISPEEYKYCSAALQLLHQIDVDNEVITKATELRKAFNMKTIDAIIAATAILKNAELYTRNISDFEHISGWHLVNPVDSK